MIVPMRHLDLVCVAAEKERTLERLRALGAVHLDLGAAVGEGVAAARGEFEDAERAVRLVLKTRGKGFSEETRPCAVADLLALDADREALVSERERLEREIKVYEPYGDFDPALARKLLDRGVDLSDRLPAKLPEVRLSAMREDLARVENRIRVIDAKIARADEKAILAQYPTLRARMEFEQAKELVGEKGELAFVSGWIPVPGVARLASAAHEEGWGLFLRDPADGEEPPTLVEPPKFFRSVTALFDGLGIAPAYTESDVSVPFLCYFAVFFAMLVGDGGYGAIIFVLTMLGWRKYRASKEQSRLMKSWLVLLTVFSLATVGWGVLSNAWFGVGIPWLANLPTVQWLGDPTYNNMMFLCFTIGASHLMLARIWNGICQINRLSCIVEFGWAGVLLFMYFVVNAIVGIFSGIPAWSYWVLGVSVAMIAAKTRGVSLGMLPLNIMGAMGDIISYVRLFAVGYASLQVAQNFNGMAVDLNLPVWAKIVPMVLILLVGHGINFMLAGLAVLVHAVRLNTLEFSNHKGLTWSGFAYRPFGKN